MMTSDYKNTDEVLNNSVVQYKFIYRSVCYDVTAVLYVPRGHVSLGT